MRDILFSPGLTPQTTMAEKQIQVVILIVDPDPLLTSDKTEIRVSFELGELQVTQDRGFKILLGVSVFQPEKLQEAGIAENQIRAHPILVAQNREFLAGQVAGFRADRSSRVEHSLNPVLERPGAPTLHPVHLGVELTLRRVLDVNDLPEVSPGELLTQCVNNSTVGEGFGKADRIEQIGVAEVRTVLFAQLSIQSVDNLLAVSNGKST